MQVTRLVDVAKSNAIELEDSVLVIQDKTVKQITRSDLEKSLNITSNGSSDVGKTAIFYSDSDYTLTAGDLLYSKWNTVKNAEYDIIYNEDDSKPGLVVPFSGTYQIIATVMMEMSQFPTGVSVIGTMIKSGDEELGSCVEVCSGLSNIVKLHFIFNIEAYQNDTIYLKIQQNSGGDAKVLSDYSRIFVTYLG